MSQKKIPLYQPALHGKEKEYVNDCLDTTWISSRGKYVDLFEKNFASYTKSQYALACSNGTVAIHLALVTLDIKQGDEVIVPTFTYVASVNPIRTCHATPIFVDSLPNTWQVDPEDIKRKITNKTKAIIVTHLYGHACNMDAIMAIAKQHNLYVIEDAAESFGTTYKGQHTGTFGHIGTFSFFGNKTITTGEGGMLTTQDEYLYKKMYHLSKQGLACYNPESFQAPKPGQEYWHDVVGYNYRMTNIQAAIGFAQLEQAEKIIAKKRQVFHWYESALKNSPSLVLLKEPPEVFSNYWMICILYPDEKTCTQKRLELKEAGIETRPLFSPIHTMPMYDTKEHFPVAEDLSKRGMNVPSYPDLSKEDVDYICHVLKK